MPTTVVVFNPIAGMRWRHRDSELHALLVALSRAGVETLTTTTRGPHASPGTLLSGIDDFDTVIACGGDGTVNEVVQELMADRRDAALGIMPFGSGNLLAKHLGIGRNVEQWLESHSRSAPVPTPVGCIEDIGSGKRRYWLAAAGVGVDARVICGITPQAKANFGIAAYYAESLRQLLFSGERFPLFEVEFHDCSTDSTRREIVAQVIVERIGYFGQFLENGTGHSLPPEELRVVLFKTAEKRAYLDYGLALVRSQVFGHSKFKRNDIEVVRTREIRCFSAEAAGIATQRVYSSSKTLAEVDGELVGELPVRLFVTARRINLLRPNPELRGSAIPVGATSCAI